MEATSARCVVCRAVVDDGSAVYPNTWEATTKSRVCCSAACRERYQPDAHWVPSRAPLPSPAELARTMAHAQRRMTRGDNLRVIVRDLLCGGAGEDAVRHFLRMAGVRLDDAQRAVGMLAPVQVASSAFALGPIGALVSLVRGEAKRERLARDAAAMVAAVEGDLTAWSSAWRNAPAISPDGRDAETSAPSRQP